MRTLTRYGFVLLLSLAPTWAWGEPTAATPEAPTDAPEEAREEVDSPIPAPIDSVVNDYAGLLGETELEELRAIGDTLYGETAVPLVIVIVPTVADYTELPTGSIEEFSEAWMSYWELADETGRGEDILVFLTVEERYLRIRLGTGYPEEAQATLQEILVDTVVPALKADAWADGLINGSMALADLAIEHFPEPPEGWVDPFLAPES